MSTVVGTKRRRWKPEDDSILRGLTIDASNSRLSNRQANLQELFALLTTQPPNADQERRCDVAEHATQTPDLGAFQTIGFSEVSHRRIGVRKIGAPPLLSTNYERSEREKCNASLYDVFTGEDQVIVVEKQQWKIPTESDTVVRNASGVLPEIGWPRDLLVPTGTGMIGPEIYDLVIEYGFSRQARKIPQGVLAAVTLRSRSEIFLEVRIFRGSYQHSDGEEYDCLDRSRPCSKDTDRTYLDADDDGTLRTASWSSRHDPLEAFEALLELRYLDAHCNSGKSRQHATFQQDTARLMPAGTANGKEGSVVPGFWLLCFVGVDMAYLLSNHERIGKDNCSSTT
ncbi:hypothetical protein MRX96_040456 [Rhipicephalus microplus]